MSWRPQGIKEIFDLIDFLAQHNEARSRHDHQIKHQRPVIDIPEVLFNAPLHLDKLACLSAQAVRLSHACESRLYMMSKGITGDQRAVFIVMGHRVRSWPDKRHVAADDVEK